MVSTIKYVPATSVYLCDTGRWYYRKELACTYYYEQNFYYETNSDYAKKNNSHKGNTKVTFADSHYTSLRKVDKQNEMEQLI